MQVSRARIRHLPKADLHSHIDGSVPLPQLFAIARRHHRRVVTPSGGEIESASSLLDHVRGGGYRDLLENIVERFAPIVGMMQTEEVLREVAIAYVAELRRQHVSYAEGRFAPQYHTKEGMSLDGAIRSMAEGLREGSERHGVRTNLIVAIGRETSAPAAEEVAHAAIRSRAAVALDLGGAEEGNPMARFHKAFNIAKSGGLRRTVHAGEGAGSVAQNLSNIRDAIQVLGADRVGHAIHISRDPTLVQLARRRSVTLEMNPVSNRVLGKIGSSRDLRIDGLMKGGLKVTVNSDDPALWTGGSLDEVLFEVCESYAFGLTQLDQLIANSFLGSFASAREKHALTDEYASARARFS